MVSLGQRVANFTLPATGDKQLSLDDFRGQYLVIYFYPKDNTPGCTRESQDFRDAHADFKAAGAAILGVSRDGIHSHEKFRTSQELPFDLLSDEDETLCQQFDVMREKNMYGRKYMGIERSTFLIDPEGTLVEEWRKVRVPGHVESVLETVRALG